MRLLFVCTGNICRSPLAERLAAAWAEQSLGAGAARVHIRSAGTDGLDGKQMDAKSASALSRLGGDPTGFRSQAFVPELADASDLVLTMTRRHRRLVLADAPRTLRRTFTLAEAADLLRTADLAGIADLPLQERARELAVRMNAGRARRRPVDADDMHDPIGQAGSVHKYVAERIARKLRPLADVLFADERIAGHAWPPVPSAAVRRPLPPLVPSRPR